MRSINAVNNNMLIDAICISYIFLVFTAPAEKIRVGRDYQVIVPEFVPVNGMLQFL